MAGLRRAVAALLLGLPLALGLAVPAAAQTPTANADGSYTVPYDWPLNPSALGDGAKFRLLFVTSQMRDGRSANIADYNKFVQDSAAVGHRAIRPYSAQFKALASTAAISARDNTGMTGTGGEPIYWLGGAKVADNYADFFDGSWDSKDPKQEGGGTRSGNRAWTGSESDGSRGWWASRMEYRALGNPGNLSTRTGDYRNLSLDPIFSETSSLPQQLPFYAVSPVFQVGPPPQPHRR